MAVPPLTTAQRSCDPCSACVAETAIDARRLGYDTTVLLDASRPVASDPVERDAALDRMRSAGAHLRWNITSTP
jgi:nicotinamidase-related amidase